MNVATYARRNLFRRPGRTILTMIVVVFAVLIFCLLRTVIVAWNSGADAAASDRLATRHKVSITMQFPKHYIDELRSVPGIKASTWANWFGAKDPQKRVPFFAGIAVDQDSFFSVYDEVSVPPDQLAAWKQTPNGAIIGDKLAEAFKVKVGDRLVISSDIYPGDWEFKISGIYQPLRKTVDRSTFYFRWDYMNNDPRAVFSKEKIGWMVSRITDAARSAEISKQIDAKFDTSDDQTSTMSERQFSLSFLAGFAAILSVFSFGSLGILVIMTLVLANTMAMNVRERTHEYGVLRAIGFPPGHIKGFILGESVLVALIGGLVGVGLTFLIINVGLAPVLEEAGGPFRGFRTPGYVFALALAGAVGLGLAAGGLPAFRASRLKVTDALRRLD
jgi:putative ABC transport system permease protein